MAVTTRRTTVRWIALVAVLAVSASAAAQHTGGSFGGRSDSWGSSSSNPSSSSSSSWRSSSSSWRSSSSSGSSSGGGSGDRDDRSWFDAREHRGSPEVTPAEEAALRPADPPITWKHLWWSLFALFFALSFTPNVVRRLAKRRAAASAGAAIARVSIGFDWTVREALQERIDALSRALSLDTPEGRAEAARAVVALLREHLSGARYALSTVERVALDDAPGAFDRLALELRARFIRETRGRRRSAEAPELRARPEEGRGMLVVSLIAGGVFEATSAEAIEDRAGLERALGHIERWAALDALEVIWSPAEPDDRMSSHELERFYPELRKLADADAVGSIACPHCGGVRPAELRDCPHCGSPST